MRVMRTTIDLDDDTAAAIDRLRRDEGLGLSEAANHLIRRGLARPQESGTKFTQSTRPLGLKIDVANVAEALELVESPDHR
jgi:hypothetical protein